MGSVTLARQAMATRFEMVLHGRDPVSLRAAGEEALDEIERLEAQLSLYRDTSEIRKINSRAAAGPVRIEPGLFRLLQHAKRLTEETGGVFDVTVAPLMRCWGFMGGTGAMPGDEQVHEARSIVGMHHVVLNEDDFTIQFEREGMMLDLGGIGKGYALERAVEILVENGITSALVHGGTSTVYGLGVPPVDENGGETAAGWKVAIDAPAISGDSPGAIEDDAARAPVVATVTLKDMALSVSAPHGKAFTVGNKTYGHVIDPRTGYPAQGALLAAVLLPSVTETDALSTALLTLGLDGLETIMARRPEAKALVVGQELGSGEVQVRTNGGFECCPG